MKFKYLIFASITLLLAGCNGGGGTSNTVPSPAPTPSIKLLPLNISLHDLNNNSIQYIDVSKVGSHTEYKLTFTNPNNIAITGLTNLNSGPEIDGNWVYYQASPNKESYPTSDELKSYYESFNPGVGKVADYFYKTINSDDCFNKTILQPKEYCSFYTLAVNFVNFTESNFFSYPLAYYIEESGNPLNVLHVQQYDYTEGYGFLKESMPNLDKQFITYTISYI